MKALLKKDWILLRGGFKQLGIMLAVFIVLAVVTRGTGDMVATLLTICLLLFAVNLFSYDEQAGFVKFACTLPGGPTVMVAERYLLLLLLILASTTANVFISLINLAIGNGFVITEIITSMLLINTMYTLSYSVAIPLIYKLGAEKMRVLLSVCFLVPGGLLLLSFTIFGDFINALPIFAVTAPVFAFNIVCLAISYAVSLRVVRHCDM